MLISERFKRVKDEMMKSHNDFNTDSYFYLLGYEAAKQLCDELGLKLGDKNKGHKIGKVFGIDAKYSPLLKNNDAYIVKDLDYFENRTQTQDHIIFSKNNFLHLKDSDETIIVIRREIDEE